MNWYVVWGNLPLVLPIQAFAVLSAERHLVAQRLTTPTAGSPACRTKPPKCSVQDPAIIPGNAHLANMLREVQTLSALVAEGRKHQSESLRLPAFGAVHHTRPLPTPHRTAHRPPHR